MDSSQHQHIIQAVGDLTRILQHHGSTASSGSRGSTRRSIGPLGPRGLFPVRTSQAHSSP
ncbi:hypothetical protein HPP92_018357 [Vanilla planifolia]|uniref:Uncharacterized protein n=1 Tax=Vanilla planifolia TaxID=51239 RepID=A0A835QEL9_VANPL|nr:hypothetical protein HPP92_018968 [Vanilla planifolia]KAG0469029.1 hypothetical protein HPP92_018357 [Vanilla planifolia]